MRTFSGWDVEQRIVQTFLFWRHLFDRHDGMFISVPTFMMPKAAA